MVKMTGLTYRFSMSELKIRIEMFYYINLGGFDICSNDVEVSSIELSRRKNYLEAIFLLSKLSSCCILFRSQK